MQFQIPYPQAEPCYAQGWNYRSSYSNPRNYGHIVLFCAYRNSTCSACKKRYEKIKKIRLGP